MQIALIAKVRNGALVRYRQAHECSQKAAAEVVGVTIGEWNSVECMRFIHVSLDAVTRIADGIGISVDEVCPPDLRKKNWNLDRIYYRDVEPGRLIAADQIRRLILPDPADEAQRNMDANLLREQLRASLAILEDRQQVILKLRFGLTDGGRIYTWKEIGERFALSPSTVSQIADKAIADLKWRGQATGLERFALDR